MPPPIQITYTVSSPANSEVPSLLTLPKDVRLIIYEVLFKREGPFLLHNRDAYHAQRPCLQHHMNMDERKELMRTFDGNYLSEIGADHEFNHAYEMGINVLLSCRQVYHEGAAILYKGNTFVFSRVTTRHDINVMDDDEDIEFYNDEQYHPFNYASRWLGSIGSQCNLLSKVILDTDALCPRDCEYGTQGFNVLPLARLIWNHPGMEHKISFAQSGRVMLIHADQMAKNSDFEEPSIGFYRYLNLVLSELVVKDCFDLKRYSFSTRLLESIYLDPHERQGVFDFYGGTSHWFHSWDNAELKIMETKPIRGPIGGLLRLMQLTRGEFITYCLPQSQRVTLDVDKHTIHGFDLNMFHVLKNLRNEFKRVIGVFPVWGSDKELKLFYRSKDFVIRMTSHELSTDFNAFAALNALGFNGSEKVFRISPICDIVTEEKTGAARTYLSLNFNVSVPSTLAMVRVDIKDFSSLSLEFESSCKTLIQFQLTYYYGMKAQREEASVSLARLQQSMFLLLSDTLQYFAVHPETFRNDIPSLWINGRGAFIQAQFPSTGKLDELSIEYAYGKLTPDEVHHMGYSMAPNRSGSVLKKLPAIKDSHLGQMWSQLLIRYWDDYRTRTYRSKQR